MQTAKCPYARAVALAASYAKLARGYYQSPGSRQEIVTMGGPAPREAIDEACEVIEACRRAGVAAPSVTPYPLADMTSSISLEWDQPSVWAIWLAAGVWELVATGHDSWSASAADVCAALGIGGER